MNILLDHLTEIEKDNFQDDIRYFNKLDLNRPFQVAGYYYEESDTLKTYAKPKENCLFKGESALSISIILTFIRASEAVELGHNIQSLHTDSNGEDMLTSWIDIDDLINTLYQSPPAELLLNQLKNWKKIGVQEVYFSWYTNILES